MDTVTSSGSTTYTSIGMNNGAMGTYSAPMDVSSGISVFAENPLVDSLLDRYNEANQRVLHLELQSEQLGKQITVATYKGLYAASPFMTKLNELKPLLEAAKVQRDKLLIIMVIQSNDIMGAVRRLRLSELFDVPQVPIVSHRKVLQLSIQINKQKKATMELNRQMSMTLNEPQVGNASSLTTRIRAISLNIQTLEENIKKLKKDRESEIVRIIQFSDKIREALKQEFHRNVEMQRQQQRQAQSFR
ncbi:hypothetical protein BBO99_00007484 [Phytophthora kernoviae]|uniref:Uncharacterized protein n=2 Tax=Phytophthora kernoviae TaxID=325452 RepID=A0A3R7J124_9STRA|nr:hypothetical protein G195_008102 [Phytophthora kernoviae 00238/432]KAG2519644.1 hypothetical protein JM16_007053 [Phytophthora kernoviae]KAG2520844.1 hypothetical protein JM18_006914 [Phytophthora kernoviae]RLN02984.1 hypothetical protein BBI17_007416 [Phytophthora kernoviae]RLN76527.1 hypothetical protein BBO99_00007484 [Phytophthora kernoviae]